MTQQEQKQLYETIMQGSSAPGQFSALAGLVFDKLDETGVEGHFEARKELCNPFGIVHGGVYYTLMDQMAGMAACSTGRGAVTLDCNVSYLQSARMGDTVRCRVEPVRVGRSIGVYEAKCYGERGELQCTGTFHMFFLGELDNLVK